MKWFQGAVVLVAAAHFFNMLANSRLFEKFAYGDNGWPLTVDSLLDQGLNPVTDFGYFYGLLTLLVDRAVFAIFGRKPDVLIGLYGVCALVVAIGLARLVRSANLRFFPALFLVSCAGLSAIARGFPSPAHAIEAALLMTALAEHAAGRLHRALLLTVLAVFFKPSLGYVYGLLLVGLILREPDRWKKLLPAAITGGIVFLLLSVCFGIEAVIRTQIPLEAMKAYANEGFGFIKGSGRDFWLPPQSKRNFDYYFGGVAGTWLIASALLLASAIGLIRRYREPVAGMVVSCAVLHFTFVLALFGNQFTWIYYTYILFAGCAVGLNLWPRRWLGNLIAFALTVACVAGQSEWLWGRDRWTRNNTVATAETEFLPAPANIQLEWAEVRRIANRYPEEPYKVLVLTRMGGPQFIAPELDGPHWWCLIEGFTSESELDRARDQIRAAEWIASPNWHDNDLMKWPAFANELAKFEPAVAWYVLDGRQVPLKSFKMYHRKR